MVNEGTKSVTGSSSSMKVINEVYFPFRSPNILKLMDAAMGAHTTSSIGPATGIIVETIPTASSNRHLPSFLYLLPR